MTLDLHQEKRWKGWERKPQHGDVIGEKYTIVGRPLGKGWTGPVYRVRSEDGQMWALKALEQEWSQRSSGLRRGPGLSVLWDAVARSNHPHLVGWSEVFTVERSVFLCMEEVEGISLRTWLREERLLPSPIAAGIGAAIASALEHLHAYRLTHRYLRPEDILLGRDGSIKISIPAVHLFEGMSAGRDIDDLGGLRYGSPEQLQLPAPVMVGPESDVYSLGLLLGEMVTGGDIHGLSRWAGAEEIAHLRKRPEALHLDALCAPWPSLLPRMLEADIHRRLSDVAWIGQTLQTASQGEDLRRTIQDAVERLSEQNGPVLRTAPRKAKPPPLQKSSRAFLPPTLPEPPPSGSHLHLLFGAFLLWLGLFGSLGFFAQREAMKKQQAEADAKIQSQVREEAKKRAAPQEIVVPSIRDLLHYAPQNKRPSSGSNWPSSPLLLQAQSSPSPSRLAALQEPLPALQPLLPHAGKKSHRRPQKRTSKPLRSRRSQGKKKNKEQTAKKASLREKRRKKGR